MTEIRPGGPSEQLMAFRNKDGKDIITVGDGSRKQELVAESLLDKDGNPTGGKTTGVGLSIAWQSGPLVRDGKRVPPNGAFVECLIAAAAARLQFLNTASEGRFQAEENEEAIKHLGAALEALGRRTAKRQRRRIEGTHIP